MTKVIMPKAGQSMEEGRILSWRKQEGEEVEKGESLLEIDTDKAAVEVEAPESGVLRKILCSEGTTVPVLAPIAVLGGIAEDISGQVAEAEAELRAILAGRLPSAASESRTEALEAAPAVEVPVEAGAAVAPTEPASSRIRASPAARRLARERGIDLGTLGAGSGAGGRIVSTDIPPAAAPQVVAPAAQGRRALTGIRRAIARTMAASKQTIPHFYTRLTIDAGPLQDFYRLEKARYSCTINDIITLACARVIREFPAFRCRVEDEEIVEYPAASIGVAVGLDEGLVVPVLVGADSKSLQEVAQETKRIVEAARRGKIVAMGQGVFTVTNLGPFGIEEFSAIINPPEVAILAVGAIREAVIVKDAMMRPGRVMTMTLSADHRVIDGLLAARFLMRLKEILEAPEALAQPLAR